MIATRDARAEAEARIGRPARVLEPSPPAAEDPPWFADDPVAASAPGPVMPIGQGPDTWDAIARGDPGLAGWCAERWLGGWRRLDGTPPGYAATRDALHRLAVYAMSPARRTANGKIGLRFTYRGFGTPFFAGDRQVRMEAQELVVAGGGTERRHRPTTLAAAAAAIGVELDLGAAKEFDVPPPGDPDAPLTLEAEATAALGDWFGFAASVLEELRASTGPEDDPPDRVQLWPEHFDMAVSMGSQGERSRAVYGGSPGDAGHPAPYLYVTPSAGLPDDDVFWIRTPFAGARLGLEALLAADDQRAAALAFFAEARRRLA